MLTLTIAARRYWLAMTSFTTWSTAAAWAGSTDTDDTAWALASPECWDLLIGRRGYSVEDYQAWVEDTLAAALLHPSLLKG
jgi:hypothetical protein